MRWDIYLSVLLCSGASASCSGDVAIEKLRQVTLHVPNGSASVVSAPSGKRYILTNGHICLHGSWHGILAASHSAGPVVRGKVAKSSLISDLCAARVSAEEPALRVASRLDRREPIYTRGYPNHIASESVGEYIGKWTWKYFWPIGEIGECPASSAPQRDGYGLLSGCDVSYTDNITTLYSRPGSSGSPVVNAAGELVGVVSSWDPEKDAGGMVPLEDVRKFLEDL